MKHHFKVEYFDYRGLPYEDIIEKLATISYNKDKSKNKQKLIETLLYNGHFGVLEFIEHIHDNDEFVIFYLEVPIYVARQIMRHRSFSYIERSMRHSKGDITFDNPFTNKYDESLADNLYVNAINTYNLLLEHNKPELARVVLPVSMTTKLYMGGNPFAYAYFFIQRLSKYAQPQTREVTIEMVKQLAKYNIDFLNYVIFSIKQIKDMNTTRLKSLNWIFGTDVKPDMIQKQCDDAIQNIHDIIK